MQSREWHVNSRANLTCTRTQISGVFYREIGVFNAILTALRKGPLCGPNLRATEHPKHAPSVTNFIGNEQLLFIANRVDDKRFWLPFSFNRLGSPNFRAPSLKSMTTFMRPDPAVMSCVASLDGVCAKGYLLQVSRVQPMLDRMTSPTPMKTIVQTATTEEFFQRGREVARSADRDASMVARRVVSFENPADMVALLSPKRLALFSAVSARPGSIADVAARLQRSTRAVGQDVNLFVRLGIFVVESSQDTAHGGRREVRAATHELELRCAVL